MKNKFSFRSAKELHEKVAMLPRPPPWKSCEVTVEGGTTKKPIKLFLRESIDMFSFLFGNPVFARNQQHVPTRIWEDDDMVFDDPMTGKMPWEVQVRD